MNKQIIKGLIEKTANGGYRVLASTNAVDRQGDVVDQNGWDTANYLKNPVMLWAHDYRALPIAKATEVSVDSKGLVLAYEFASAEANPFAQQVKELVDGGFLNAVSVGFIPKERNGNIITRSELLEVSFVPVPANQEALQLMSAKGFSPEMVAGLFTKGAVADELDAEEVAELKWENWHEFCEIISALWTVYFNDASKVEDFSMLLNEAITLMQDLTADGNTPTEEQTASMKQLLTSAKTAENVSAFVDAMKEGRTLSGSTLKAIDASIESMKNSITVLEGLKNASAENGDGAEKGNSTATNVEVIKEANDNKNEIRLSVEEFRVIQSSLRTNDRANETALSLVNRHLANRGK